MRAVKMAAVAVLAIPALAACASTQSSEALNTAPVAYTEAFGTLSAIDWTRQCAPHMVGSLHGDYSPDAEGYASPEEAVQSSLKLDVIQDISLDNATIDVVAGSPGEEAFNVDVLVSTDQPVIDYLVSSSGKGGTWLVDEFTQCTDQQIIDGHAVTDK